MSLHATTESPASRPLDGTSVPLNRSPFLLTEGAVSESTGLRLAPSSNGPTEVAATSGTARHNLLWQAPSSEQSRATSPVAPSPQQAAKGVVLHVTADSVQCEFLYSDEPTRVWLPKSLFPSNVLPGLPFSLSVDRENGYWTPRISERPPELAPELNSKLVRLLDQLVE